MMGSDGVSQKQALSDIKVLDLTQRVVGPYCTKLMADFGADVVKIEEPEKGDETRRKAPFFEDDPHPEKSGAYGLRMYANFLEKALSRSNF